MSSRGKFYDQDEEKSGLGRDEPPAPIRWGGFYDQDASIEQPRLDTQTLARIEREVAERRERERQAAERRAEEAQDRQADETGRRQGAEAGAGDWERARDTA